MDLGGEGKIVDTHIAMHTSHRKKDLYTETEILHFPTANCGADMTATHVTKTEARIYTL